MALSIDIEIGMIFFLKYILSVEILLKSIVVNVVES